MSTSDIVLALTPVISLAATAGVRALIPKIPGWLVPVVAALIGVSPDLITHLVTGSAQSPLVAALLGLAATGLHQIKVQFTKQTNEGTG